MLLKKQFDQVSEGVQGIEAIKSKIPEIFTMVSGDKAVNEYYNVGTLGDIPQFNGRLTYLEMSPGFHIKIEPAEFAAGLEWQRKFVDDNQYSVMKDGRGKLMASLMRTKEKKGASPFIDGFSTAYAFQTSEEGVSLFSTAHLTKSGTSTSSGFSNSGTSSLSRTSVAATRILMKMFRNDRSELFEAGDDYTLIVPLSLEEKANEIVASPSNPDNANDQANFHKGRYNVIPWVRLEDNDTNNWFMVNNALMKDSLIWIDRIMPETNLTVDFETFALKDSIYARFAWGQLDWRFGYGHNVT
jgi:hypothetical protein